MYSMLLYVYLNRHFSLFLALFAVMQPWITTKQHCIHSKHILLYGYTGALKNILLRLDSHITDLNPNSSVIERLQCSNSIVRVFKQ